MRSRFLISAVAMVGAALVVRRQRSARAERLLLGPGPPAPETAGGDRGGGDLLALVPPAVETGPFAVAGQALAPGHVAVAGVSFARRRPEANAAEAVRLVVDSSHNVPEGGLVVLGQGGFAPDPEGFTLMLASAGAGPFAASGRYELLGPTMHGSPTGANPQGDPDR